MMRLINFTSALKEIVLTSIAALLLFSIAAAQSAVASETTPNELNNQLSVAQTIEWVTHTESDYKKMQDKLDNAQADFDKGDISLSELFKAQVSFNQAEERVMVARTKLLISLSNIKDDPDELGQPVTLAFSKAL
ncbi:TolC family protein [Glaciecola sp. KUL10]|uniref:TolC family protein n=1 Tax=Glaciecola sp. (strain KUL10) TaxID=2161813 RepID=UPI000D784D4F|nr:TolC family protein [Glaciecola sp. KUL10]GBL04967.1 hypothetical protein KUL10_22850 [Glaciecola sp. KUL10]